MNEDVIYSFRYIDRKYLLNGKVYSINKIKKYIKEIIKEYDVELRTTIKTKKFKLAREKFKVSFEEYGKFKKIVDSAYDELAREKKIKNGVKLASKVSAGALAIAILTSNFNSKDKKNDTSIKEETTTNYTVMLNDSVFDFSNMSSDKLRNILVVLENQKNSSNLPSSTNNNVSLVLEKEEIENTNVIEEPVTEETKESEINETTTNNNNEVISNQVIYDSVFDTPIPISEDYLLDENVKKYDEIIQRAADSWGVSRSIIRSVLAHESAGEGENLMQVLPRFWKDQIMTVYNFDLERDATIVLTDNKEKYYGQVDFIIGMDEIYEPENNIYYGAAMLADEIENKNQNILLGIDGYNKGRYRENNLIDEYSSITGISKEEIMNNDINQNYVDFVANAGVPGDPNYIYNVARKNFLQEPFEFKTREGNIIRVSFEYTQNMVKSR